MKPEYFVLMKQQYGFIFKRRLQMIKAIWEIHQNITMWRMQGVSCNWGEVTAQCKTHTKALLSIDPENIGICTWFTLFHTSDVSFPSIYEGKTTLQAKLLVFVVISTIIRWNDMEYDPNIPAP